MPDGSVAARMGSWEGWVQLGAAVGFAVTGVALRRFPLLGPRALRRWDFGVVVAIGIAAFAQSAGVAEMRGGHGMERSGLHDSGRSTG